MTDEELADSIIRKMAVEGHIAFSDGGIALIDSGWTDLTDAEIAYLQRVRAAAGDSNETENAPDDGLVSEVEYLRSLVDDLTYGGPQPIAKPRKPRPSA